MISVISEFYDISCKGRAILGADGKIVIFLRSSRIIRSKGEIDINKNILLILSLIFMVVGCSAQKNEVNQAPKFTIAADVRNDAVVGVTPEIEQALIKSYLSDKKSPKVSDDFKRVVNSSKVTGGTVFLVRTKGGFNTFFVEASSQKVIFVSGVESEIETNSPGVISILRIRDQTKDFSRIAIGTFNIAEATKAVVTWNDGHQTTHDLTNGTFIIEPKDNESELKQWEVFDSSGTSIYKQQINLPKIAKKGSGGIEALGLWLTLGIFIILIIIYKVLKRR